MPVRRLFRCPTRSVRSCWLSRIGAARYDLPGCTTSGLEQVLPSLIGLVSLAFDVCSKGVVVLQMGFREPGRPASLGALGSSKPKFLHIEMEIWRHT